ncbi:MAG: type IX secretion system PorP/SprF family membrane protein [Cyclobacteriaceae bacterium]|jgi:type IX secretion system PorP/SprF family membrane protein
MKKIKILILSVGIVFTMANTVMGQQQVMFTQYMFNGLALNPAYAGHDGALSITALTRHQWVGIDGAPNTQTLSIHTPIKKNKIAVGALVYRDQIGLTTETGVTGSYAYRIDFGKGNLSMGMQFGFSEFRNNQADAYQGSNVVVDPYANGQAFKPNIGAGFFYSTERFYLGISSPFLLNNKIETADDPVEQIRHLFATSGFVVDLNRHLKLKPSVLLKMVQGAPLQMDFSAMLLIEDRIWVGFSYRSFDSIDLVLELQLNSKFSLGYAYDYSVTALNQVNSGSHELMLNYILSFSRSRVITPRYF